MTDSYLTIAGTSTGEYTEKRSKFLAFAFHIESVDEVKALVQQYEKQYYDARHVCYAYMLGHLRENFRAVDNGEPSGTAGKPILGQINRNELTNILIIVVRYFGGIKLGSSGLANAYKQAAAESIANASIEERTVDVIINVMFEYPLMNEVMRVVKDMNPIVVSQDFIENCTLKLQIRQGDSMQIQSRLKQIRGVAVEVCD